MIVLIDNFDSFSYNLYQLVGELDPDIKVVRNNELTAAEICALAPSRLILSPGPGRPVAAGVCEELVRAAAERRLPLLGVCLGHQAICEVFGAEITYAPRLMHGKTSVVTINNDNNDVCPLFRGLPRRITVGRYHSLAARPDTMPDSLRVTAQTDAGEIMAVSHKHAPIFGVQFHPESILTPQGRTIIRNFLQIQGYKQ